MKYHGAREGYDPKKLDDKRRSEGSLIPFPFRDDEKRTDVDSKERRRKNYIRKHKRSMKTTKKKHGRSV